MASSGVGWALFGRRAAWLMPPGCAAFLSIHATVSGIFTFQGRIMQILSGILLSTPRLIMGGPMPERIRSLKINKV